MDWMDAGAQRVMSRAAKLVGGKNKKKQTGDDLGGGGRCNRPTKYEIPVVM